MQWTAHAPVRVIEALCLHRVSGWETGDWFAVHPLVSQWHYAIGMFLPWLEMVAGAALLVGVAQQGALLIATILFTVFTVAQLSVVVRGLAIDCGCGLGRLLGQDDAQVSIMTISRSTVLAAVTFFCLVVEGRPRPTHRQRTLHGSARAAVVNVLVAALLLVPALSSAAGVQDDNDHPDRDNAAYWYQKAIERLSSYTLTEQAVVSLYAQRGVGSAEEVTALLQRDPTLLALIRRGGQQDYSDFGLRYADGPTMLMPHLSQNLQLAAFILADAGLALERGDSAGAGKSLKSALEISQHVTRDNTMWSAKVGSALLQHSHRFIELGVANGSLEGVAASRLLQSVRGFTGDDPFKHLDALVADVQRFHDWTVASRSDNERRAQLDSMLATSKQLTDEHWMAMTAAMTSIRDMSDAELQDATTKMNTATERIAAAFRNPDHDAARMELAAIDEEMKSGGLGELALAYQSLQQPMPLVQVYESMLAGRDTLAKTTEILEKAIDPEDRQALLESNAAYWYLRAIAERAMVKHVADDNTDELPDALLEREAANAEHQRAAREYLFAGSECTYCNFDALVEENPNTVLPAYVVGMDGLVRAFFLADDAIAGNETETKPRADVEAHEHTPPWPLDELTALVRIALHLSRDANVSASILSVEILGHVLPEIDQLESLPPVLRGALEEFSLSDTCGLASARAALREACRNSWWVTENVNWPLPHSGAMQRYIGSDDGASYARLIDIMLLLHPPQAFANIDRARLQVLLDLDDVLMPAIRAGDYERIETWPVVDPLDIARYETSARTAKQKIETILQRERERLRSQQGAERVEGKSSSSVVATR
ncbi:MAG: MauE/DoxX family redox-associated membrane protein [Phycisphaerales bacterium]